MIERKLCKSYEEARKIYNQVEEITGLKVKKINIFVEGVRVID